MYFPLCMLQKHSKFAPAAPKIKAITLLMSILTPKFSRLRRARISAFPIVYSLHNANFSRLQRANREKWCGIARRRREKFPGFVYFIGGNDSGLARRRRENFGFLVVYMHFLKVFSSAAGENFGISVQTRLSPPYDLAEIGREGGDR